MSSGQQDPPATTRADAAEQPLAVVVRFAIPEQPDATARTRDHVRATMQLWSIDSVTANIVLDVAHEMVSNAQQHGAAPIGLTLEHSASIVTVTVRDGSTTPVRRLPYRAGVSEHGLGVRLIAQLSDDWGQRIENDGKSVWAIVRRRRAD